METQPVNTNPDDDQMFRRMIDGIRDYGLFLLDPGGQILSWNVGATTTTGFSPSDAVGLHFSVLFAPQDVAWGKPNHLLRAAELSHCEDEGWLMHKDGSRYFGAIAVSALRDGQGILSGFSVILRDITARRRSDNALRDGERRLRTIVDSAVDGILTIDEKGLIESANPAAERIFGYAEDELIGQNVKMLMPAPYKDEHDQYLLNFLHTGHRKIIGIGREVLGRRRDGSIFPMDLGVSEVKLGERRIFAGIVRDITDRRRAEQATRDSEAKHRAVFENAVDGIITIDERGTIKSANPAAERIFGYAEQELVGHNVKMLMPSPYREEHDQYLANYLQTGQRKIIGIGREVVGLRKDGSTFPMDLAVSEMFIGDRRMFTGLVRDVSQRNLAERERERLLESERAARAELERANHAKDEFLAILSHELRTPLAPVLLAVSSLEQMPGLPPEAKEDIQSIRRGAELEARLIDDLLDLTRVSRGKLQLSPRPSDLHELIQGAIQICRREDGARVFAHLDALQHMANVDPARFQQVVWNLLNNAYKFTPAAGTISIRTTNPYNAMFRLEVQDTGIGIEPQFLSRIFSAFEQGDPATSRRIGGLGLGLAISRAIVQAHGGNIGVFSAGKGKGSTFFVEWPGVSSALGEQARTPAPTELITPDHLRILLVEDHALTLAALQRILRRMGHQVVPASRVNDALDAAHRNPIDLLVSDLGLPDGTGLDLLRQLRQEMRLPAIAVSGYGTAEDLRRSREAGFAEHLVKPVAATDLAAAIQRVAGAAH